MAPPSPRRPGFSRRAQYGIFASYVVAVVGAGIGLLLVLTARFDPEGHSALQGFLTDITAPISSAGRATVNTVKNSSAGISNYFDAASKNEAMNREVKAARMGLIKGAAAEQENRRLRAMVGLIERSTSKPVAVARLISSTGSSSRRYATLAAGSVDGVKRGQPIVGPDGLVGRVVQANQITARVLLIVDGGNIVPVKRASDGVPAFAIGLGNGMLEIRPLTAGNNPFNPKDVFITSGSGGIYRPGIPVAVAVRKTREGTFARARENPASLDFAVVEQPFVAPTALPPEVEPPPGEAQAASGAPKAATPAAKPNEAQ
jgi:rod shape-determining protein MreC